MPVVQIEPLADHSHHLPTLIRWASDQWPDAASEPIELTLGEDSGCPPHWLALDSDTLVGFLTFKRFPINDQPELALWINSLFVAPDWRRQGIGRRLLEQGISSAKGYGEATLYVYTELRSYYEPQGWQWVPMASQDSRIDVLKLTL